MKRPILFNTEMVKAILEGRKTQTRRIVKKKYNNTDIECMANKPYKVGDILYIRETWTVEGVEFEDDEWVAYIGYKAEGDTQKGYQTKMKIKENEVEKYNGYLYSETEYKPSIHMPKSAARIFLKVTDVRAGRLQDITEEDAKAEGVKKAYYIRDSVYHNLNDKDNYRDGFRELWDNCYKYPKSWDANPWVWVIEFERIRAN